MSPIIVVLVLSLLGYDRLGGGYNVIVMIWHLLILAGKLQVFFANWFPQWMLVVHQGSTLYGWTVWGSPGAPKLSCCPISWTALQMCWPVTTYNPSANEKETGAFNTVDLVIATERHFSTEINIVRIFIRCIGLHNEYRILKRCVQSESNAWHLLCSSLNHFCSWVHNFSLTAQLRHLKSPKLNLTHGSLMILLTGVWWWQCPQLW